MRNLSLVAVAATLFLASLFAAPSLLARQQTVPRFEYLRVETYGGPVMQRGQTVLVTFLGYRACVAASTEWVCRDFPQENTDALRNALATLGSEGWELVSAGYDPQGSTAGNYLFKRRSQ